MRPLQQILVESNSDAGIIVYHASKAKFSRFDDNKIKNALTAGFGHYFSESQDLAVRFLEDRSGYLYKVRLNVTDDQIAYAFTPLARQPHALRALENIVKTLTPEQDRRMFRGVVGHSVATAREIRYSLEEMSWNMAESRLASTLAGHGDTKDKHHRRAAGLFIQQGIFAVCFHDIGAPAGVYNFNCFDPSKIEILDRQRIVGSKMWWDRDDNY